MKQLPVVLLTLLLAACTASPAEVDKAVDDLLDTTSSTATELDKMMDEIEGEEASSAMSADAPATTSLYQEYSDDVLMNGEEKVVFFHASWCPNCRANDTKLQDWSAADAYTVPVYKIDYDAATELKAKLGVTSQDTFVLVDGKGNVLQSVTFPDEAKLQALLK